MQLKTPLVLNTTLNVDVPTQEVLQKLPCGIHRGVMADVEREFSCMVDTLKTAPVNLDDYEIDIKVHMLMKGQYPCIPNWHCDNIPRDGNGNLIYDIALADVEHPMLLWLSGNPTTEFLENPIYLLSSPRNHGELHERLVKDAATYKSKPIPERTWVSMDQLTPHRGRASEENTWRIFIRLTHKNIVTARPVISVVRRHCQVYLPADFHW
ncbi:hypothetical protein LCGC14_2093860 [marine sediment metagenome]|uniref:TauD/TfdA-like domain-containing protein n=1 Tax=marine sediment metagenome TaxID=412755 RepID=A0A0F9EBV8_9ZZZZ